MRTLRGVTNRQDRQTAERRRNLLATTAFVLGVAAAPATWASTVTFDPAATNDGMLTLDPNQGDFSVTGGQGTVYGTTGITNTDGSSATFSSVDVINLTSFLGTNCGSLCGLIDAYPGYQLFAVVSITGTGSWSDPIGGETFTANSISGNIQLYGVQVTGTNSLTDSTPASFGQIPNSTLSSNAVPASDLTAAAGSLTQNQFNALSISGTQDPEDDACIDDFNASKCILLANGNVSGSSNFSITDPTNEDTELFSLVSSLTPESYATFFDGSVGPLTLTINSETCDVDDCNITGETPIDVIDGERSSTEYYCTDWSNSCTNGSDVNWAVTGAAAVPEPASLALLGTSILGLAGAIRRRRKQTA